MPDARRALGRAAPGRRGLAGDPDRRRQDRGPAPAAQGGGAARGRDRAGRRRIRHGDRRRRPRRPRRGGLRRVGGPAHDWWSSARRPAARPAPPLGSRTTSAFPRVSRGTSWQAGRCSRRAGWAPRSSSPGRSTGSTPPTASCTSMPATLSARGRSSSPAASPGGTCRSRGSTASPARGSSTAPPAARLRTRTASTSTSSAPATRPARRPSSSQPTRAA